MKQQFIKASIISLIFLVAGLTLLHFELIAYGFAVFAFLPLTLGFIFAGTIKERQNLFGVFVTVLIFLVSLVATGIEGIVCLVMALPLIIIALIFGVLLRNIYNKWFNKRTEETTLKTSVIPFVLFLVFGVIENQLTKNDHPVAEVRTSIVLPNSPLQVYETIKSVDTLNAEKPFLMKLDLPVPHKCVLEEEKVGGIRTCYFDGGMITERITELEKGKILKMDVIDYTLPVGRWLRFNEAIYTFEDFNDGCKMTRITTYSSQLYPRFYWKPLERIGIEQEHEYVFSNLKKDLQRKFGVKQ